MALELKLSSSIVNYTSLNIIDSTGEYNINTNPTGWGAPNPLISNVIYAHINVTLPNSSVVDIDLIGTIGIDFSTATADTLIYNIPSALLYGTSGVLPDGIYGVEYVIFTGDDYSTTATIMTYYTAQEGVYNRIKLIPQYYTKSECNNPFVDETSRIFMLLQALIASTQYSNTTRFTTILEGLTRILSFDTSNLPNCGC